mmetsp:Transcript_14974/g.41420  ORF Transcript_14974/g.41420 Transcript_14974/m.41420 type:complete len:242 (-) Transcript_14974:886-1611(-)
MLALAPATGQPSMAVWAFLTIPLVGLLAMACCCFGGCEGSLRCCWSCCGGAETPKPAPWQSARSPSMISMTGGLSSTAVHASLPLATEVPPGTRAMVSKVGHWPGTGSAAGSNGGRSEVGGCRLSLRGGVGGAGWRLRPLEVSLEREGDGEEQLTEVLRAPGIAQGEPRLADDDDLWSGGVLLLVSRPPRRVRKVRPRSMGCGGGSCCVGERLLCGCLPLPSLLLPMPRLPNDSHVMDRRP